MRRPFALLTILAYLFSAVPAYAHRRFRTESLPAIAPAGESLTNACSLNDRFLNLHTAIVGLAKEAYDTGITARDLHYTPESHPYRLIEDGWADVSTRSGPLLDILAHFPTALDSASDTPAKTAALDLTAAYQNALAMIIDYTHAADNFGHTEHAIARSPKATWKLNFAVPAMRTRAYSDLSALQLLDARYTEIGDALRSLKLPEYRYMTRCGGLLAAAAPAKIPEPCQLASPLIAINTEVERLGETAIRMGERTYNLRQEYRWRPFKNIERAWVDIRASTERNLETLSEMPVALDAAPDNRRKQTALELIAQDQNALQKITDYAHFSVSAERASNPISTESPLLINMGFGIRAGINNVRTNQQNLARALLEGQFTKVPDALRTLHLPQHRFAELCRVTFPSTAHSRAPLAAVKNPCAFTGRFLALHETITKMAASGQEAGAKAERLNHTSLITRYKSIQTRFVDIYAKQKSAFNLISTIQLKLDDLPESEKKKAALNLTLTYLNATEHIVDYAHIAHYYTTTQNSISWNFNPGKLSFGVPVNGVRMGGDNLANNLLEARVTEVPDALRSLKFPEYTYGKFCRAPHFLPRLATRL